jgi:hypothetical protein
LLTILNVLLVNEVGLMRDGLAQHVDIQIEKVLRKSWRLCASLEHFNGRADRRRDIGLRSFGC